MITPKSIVSTDLENFKSKRYAISEPVQAPVNGNGTATNMINPRYSYLIILPSARSLVLLKSQSMTFVQNRNLLKNFSTNLKNKRTNGIGNMLPSIAKGKTCHKFQLNSHNAYGMMYLDSIQGIIDPKNIWNHSGNISNMFIHHLSTNLPKPWFPSISCSSISFSPLTKTCVGKIAGQPSNGDQPHLECKFSDLTLLSSL